MSTDQQQPPGTPSLTDFVAAGVAALQHLADRSNDYFSQLISDWRRRTANWGPILEALAVQAAEWSTRVQDAYDEGVPPSWQGLTVEQSWRVIELMKRTGWCLTITPSTELLIELLEASDDAERERILLAHEPMLLADLDRALRDLPSDPLGLYQRAAREALEAHLGGLFIASQAASANTLAALVDGRGPLKVRSMAAARARLATFDVDEAGLREIRFYAVAAAVARTLESFPRSGPVPAFFNRHATAHALDEAQQSQFNGLTALMLLVGFLRELVWLAGLDESAATTRAA